MSEPVEMAELTEAEREEITRLFGYVPDDEPLEHMLSAVSRIKAAARRVPLLEAAEHFTARANAAHRDELHMVSDTWDAAAADLREFAEPTPDDAPCSCGSRDATSLTPGERLHHSPDGCTIERGGEDGR